MDLFAILVLIPRHVLDVLAIFCVIAILVHDLVFIEVFDAVVEDLYELLHNRGHNSVRTALRHLRTPNFIRLTAAEGTTIVTQEVSSSEMRKRMRMQHVHQFGDDERANMLQGNFTMVDGLLTPAVLAHIMRYRLYSVQA